MKVSILSYALNMKANITARRRNDKPLQHGSCHVRARIAAIAKEGSECIKNPAIFCRMLPSMPKTSRENNIRKRAKAMAVHLAIRISLPTTWLLLNPVTLSKTLHGGSCHCGKVGVCSKLPGPQSVL